MKRAKGVNNPIKGTIIDRLMIYLTTELETSASFSVPPISLTRLIPLFHYYSTEYMGRRMQPSQVAFGVFPGYHHAN